MSKGIEEKQIPQCGDLEVEKLARKFQAGDPQAFDALVGKFQTTVFNLAYRMLGSYEDAADMAQEVFVKVYRNIGKFRGDSLFSTWLYSVAANTCRSRIRSARRERSVQGPSLDGPSARGDSRPRMEAADPGVAPSELLEHKEVRDLVEKSISGLSPEFSAVIVMRDLEGLDYREIASALGCSLGTVKSRLWRARTVVKDQLKRVYGG